MGVGIRTLQGRLARRDIQSTMVYLKAVQSTDALAKVSAGLLNTSTDLRLGRRTEATARRPGGLAHVADASKYVILSGSFSRTISRTRQFASNALLPCYSP